MKHWRDDKHLLLFLLLFAFSFDLPGAEVDITCTPPQVTARQGEIVTLNFIVRNLSAYTLKQAGNFFISYHARDRAGRMVRFDNRRFSLPVAVKIGGDGTFLGPGLLQPRSRCVPAGMGPGPRGGILGPGQILGHRFCRAAPAAARSSGF